MDEAHVVQSMAVQKRTSSLNNPLNDTQRAFSRQMQEGNMRAAINILQRVESEQSVLKLDDVAYGRTVKEMLTDIHPSPGTISEEALLSKSIENVIGHHSTAFLVIYGKKIISAAPKTNGSAEPSWKERLAEAVADFAIRLASEVIPQKALKAY
ncbi:hypothetical protein GJ496_006434, partial [Pomphorhynchus laevis]